MGLFDIFKKSEKFELKNIEFIDETKKMSIPKTNLKYKGIEITIFSNVKESMKHINEDFKILEKEGIEKLVKEFFIPWLKGKGFEELDDDKIFNGLKLYGVSYDYLRIASKSSPTKKDDYFGEFTFDFESKNEYTKKLIQASSFVVLVNNGKIYPGRHFDI